MPRHTCVLNFFEKYHEPCSACGFGHDLLTRKSIESSELNNSSKFTKKKLQYKKFRKLNKNKFLVKNQKEKFGSNFLLYALYPSSNTKLLPTNKSKTAFTSIKQLHPQYISFPSSSVTLQNLKLHPHFISST